jgi:hypothetical protein
VLTEDDLGNIVRKTALDVQHGTALLEPCAETLGMYKKQRGH